jgi:hypothetical protein
MLRPHKPVLAAVAMLVLTAAGCGSSDSKSSSTETAANGKTNTNKQAAGNQKKGKKEKQDPNACGRKGITPETTTEGTCAQGKGSAKHDVTYVNGDGTLKLKELDIKVNKVSRTDSVSGPAGAIKPVPGKDKKTKKTIPKTFIVVDLTWKNTGDKPQQLNASRKQVRLQTAGGGGQAFIPAEKADADSLYNAKPVKPGKKQTAVAIYQVPTQAAAGIKLRGSHPQLAVWEFSTADEKKTPPSGFIRLWNL